MNKGARSLTEKSATGEAFAILAILLDFRTSSSSLKKRPSIIRM